MANTTGELLVEMSTLSTGTALEHFTNISFGGTANAPSISVIDIVNASGIASNDGELTITATGGTSPYTYSIGWAYQANNHFTGLSAGTYTIGVKDISGYTDTIAGILISSLTSNVPVITGLDITDATSVVIADGVITVIASGGATPYTYAINDGEYQVSNTFSHLGFGEYSVTVKDADNAVNRLSGIKVGSRVKRGGGYGRSWERHQVYVNVNNVKTKDVEKEKKIKVKVNV